MGQPKLRHELRIFAASPNDVAEERKRLGTAVNEVNEMLRSSGMQTTLRLSTWENVPPSFDILGPQGVIDSTIRPAESDIFVAIFWNRFGTPVSGSGSGTEHELREAIELWKLTDKPKIMLYFSQKPSTQKTRAEAQQLEKVLELKEEFSTQGLLSDYSDPEDFERRFRDHLWKVSVTHESLLNRAESPQQGLLFVVSGEPRLIRHDGITEHLGDLTISPQTTRFAAVKDQDLLFDIQVSLNSAITSRITANGHTEAILTFTNTTGANERATVAGNLIAINSVIFESVALDFGTVWKISGLRANASAPSIDTPILAFVSIRQRLPSPCDFIVLNVPLALGIQQSTMAFRVLPNSDSLLPVELDQAGGVNSRILRGEASPTFILSFREEFSRAFKTRDQESGLVPADCGTLLYVYFSCVGKGVSIFVSRDNVAGFRAPKLAEIQATLRDTTPPLQFPAILRDEQLPPPHDVNATSLTKCIVDGIELIQLNVENGVATAVWEWVGRTKDFPFRCEEVKFSVFLSLAKHESGLESSVSLGTSLVCGGIGPVSFTTHASPGPIPRFTNLGSDLLPWYSIISTSPTRAAVKGSLPIAVTQPPSE